MALAPPGSCTTLVSNVGTLNIFADLARATTLLIIRAASMFLTAPHLKTLMVDQHQDAIGGRQQGIEAGLRWRSLHAAFSQTLKCPG